MCLADIGVVVIGRNEGDRLRRCLEALTNHPGPVVYVDSASTDDSVAIAQSKGVEIVLLDSSSPLTAARARNAGFERLRQIAPSARFVQFVDGDTGIVPGWFEAARGDLARNPQHGIVTGHLRELAPYATPYNTICDVEWRGPVGDLPCCGGIFMIRAELYETAGGFDATIIAAEDDDFCFRVRRLGATVVRLDHPMALHDAAMTNIRQWWKRAVRSGHALAQTAARHGSWQRPRRYRRLASAWIWTVGLPAAVCVGVIVAGPWATLALAAYPIQLWKVMHATIRQGNARYASFVYALHCLATKVPQCWGQWIYFGNALRGRQSALIEHKHASLSESRHSA